jgi:hypothetical protein
MFNSNGIPYVAYSGSIMNTHMNEKLLTIVKTHVYKVKDFPGHTMKAYRGIRGIAPLILNFSSRWRGRVKFMPRLL